MFRAECYHDRRKSDKRKNDERENDERKYYDGTMNYSSASAASFTLFPRYGRSSSTNLLLFRSFSGVSS
jgi:hypothetical protein